jgi:Holliday junction DNA helicase RuvB
MGYHSHGDLVERLKALKECDFFHIDEAHRLGPLEQELLCEAIDEGSVPDLLENAEKPAAERQRLRLPRWTLLLSTDQPGKLVNALHKRMVHEARLDLYMPRELREIVATQAGNLRLLLSPQGARLIAGASNGLPRLAKHHLEGLRFHFPDSENRQLGQRDVRAFFRSKGIDEFALGPMERRYLTELAKRHTASKEALALLLGTDSTFLSRRIEDNLHRRSLIEIGSRGRRLTRKGKALVNRLLGVSQDRSKEAQ